MARQPKEIKKSKVTYLPPVYDSKRIREGVLAILNLVETYGTKPNSETHVHSSEANCKEFEPTS